MTITRIRGGQIQDRTIDGIKLKQLAVTNEHIATNAAIEESKLAINWASHSEALQNKKVLDYVQINEQSVGELNKIDVSLLVGANTPAVKSNETEEGVVIDAPNNTVVIRDAVSGDPIIGINGKEVFGRIEYTPAVLETALGVGDGVPAKYEIAFYEIQGTDEEIAFVMPKDQKIKAQYLRRFNLLTVSEMFAANEKFADGVADTNARLDLEQLAKDLYGNSWSLDHDGKANAARSLVEEILAQTSGATNTTSRASEIIDEVIIGRGAFDSLDARLDDIEDGITTVENEIVAARGTEANINARLDKIEAKDLLQDAIVTDLASTDAAGKGAEMVGVRDVAEQFEATNVEDALAELYTKILDVETNVPAAVKTHGHKKHIEQIVAQASVINMPAGETFKNDGTLDVYVNGILQANGVNFTEVYDLEGKGISIDFGSDPVLIGDVVILKYVA